MLESLELSGYRFANDGSPVDPMPSGRGASLLYEQENGSFALILGTLSREQGSHESIAGRCWYLKEPVCAASPAWVFGLVFAHTSKCQSCTSTARWTTSGASPRPPTPSNAFRTA